MKINLHILQETISSISEKFHQKTKIKKLPKDTLSPKNWPREWKTIHFKGYGRLDEIPLPLLKELDNISLKEVLYKRHSGRKFGKKPLSLQQLSSLLYHSAGLRTNKPPLTANRFYPSAGARYPLEVYLIALNAALPRGLYHYYLKNHSLEKLLTFNKFEFKKYFNQDWIAKTGCLIIITAVFKRNTVKYGDRGYRHILIEAGHLGQNIYLLSAALDLSCCAIGGYTDDKLNELLDIDGINESVIYLLAVGNS